MSMKNIKCPTLSYLAIVGAVCLGAATLNDAALSNITRTKKNMKYVNINQYMGVTKIKT